MSSSPPMHPEACEPKLVDRTLGVRTPISEHRRGMAGSYAGLPERWGKAASRTDVERDLDGSHQSCFIHENIGGQNIIIELFSLC